MIEKKTIFDFEDKLQVSSPFDDWIKERLADNEITREKKRQASLIADSIPKESPFQSGDIFIFNYEELFLVRDYGKKTQRVLWRTPASSGNGKYINNPKYSDVKYDDEKHVGGPIPKGWYYLSLDDFTANKTSSDGLIKDGTSYKGYEPDRRGGPWGEWAKQLHAYYNFFGGSTDTKGRDGFFLHEDGNQRQGGNAVGSGGCVATNLDEKGIRLVIRDVKQAYELDNTYIYLLADQNFRLPDLVLFHKVVEGDTLYSLSVIYGVTISSIQKTNKLKGNTIVKGTLLMIRKPYPVG